MPPRRQIVTTEAGPSQPNRPPSRASGKGPDMVESKAKTPRPPSKIKKEAQVEALVESITQDISKLAHLTQVTEARASKKEQEREIVTQSKSMPRGPKKSV